MLLWFKFKEMIFNFTAIAEEVGKRIKTSRSDYFRFRMAMLGIKNDLTPKEKSAIKAVLKEEYESVLKTLNN